MGRLQASFAQNHHGLRNAGPGASKRPPPGDRHCVLAPRLPTGWGNSPLAYQGEHLDQLVLLACLWRTYSQSRLFFCHTCFTLKQNPSLLFGVRFFQNTQCSSFFLPEPSVALTRRVSFTRSGHEPGETSPAFLRHFPRILLDPQTTNAAAG